MNNCELCKSEKITEWIYEDDICWVAICETCGKPMIVLCRHTMMPMVEELQHISNVLFNLFGNATLRIQPGRITDHLHFHILH